MLCARYYHLQVPVSKGLCCSLCLYNLVLGTYHTGKLGVKGLLLYECTLHMKTILAFIESDLLCLLPAVSDVGFTLLKHMPL